MTDRTAERLLVPKLGADGMMTITEAAKAMRAKPTALFAFLAGRGLIERCRLSSKEWLTTPKGRGSGVVTDREWRGRSGMKERSYAVVTPKGLSALWKYKQERRAKAAEEQEGHDNGEQ